MIKSTLFFSIHAKYAEDIQGHPQVLFRERSRGKQFIPRAIIGITNDPNDLELDKMFDPINIVHLPHLGESNNYSDT